MGKKRKGSTVDGVKPKKHKKNKHRHHPEGVEASPLGKEEVVRPIKLKIKLGDQFISSDTIGDILPDDTSSPAESEPQSLVGGAYGSSVGGGAEGSSLGIPEEDIMGSDMSMGKDEYAGSGAELEEEKEEEVEVQEEDDQEEEAWLEALEAGEVNERGYLPQMRNASSLTSRQRAMLGEEGEGEELMELPLGRSSEQLTEEMLLQKTEKNRKRRLAAQKRKEKRKAETVRKLLEKQCTKKKDEDKKVGKKETREARITYISRLDQAGNVETILSLPPGVEFPLKAEKLTAPPPPVTLCAAKGCQNPKKYSDSVSKLPLCSLQCYKDIHHQTGKSLSPPAVA